MIHTIIGFPGSGKTTHAAYLAHKFQRKHIKVYSNIPELSSTIPVELSDFGRYDISHGVVIFDEAGPFRYSDE